MPVLFALSILISIGFGGIGMFMAIRTGSGEAVQGMFPLLFVFLFFSSISMPRNLIEHEWFRTIATINPVSYLIEGIRSLLIYGWDGEALALAFGIAIGLIVDLDHDRLARPAADRMVRHMSDGPRRLPLGGARRSPGAASTTPSPPRRCCSRR